MAYTPIEGGIYVRPENTAPVNPVANPALIPGSMSYSIAQGTPGSNASASPGYVPTGSGNDSNVNTDLNNAYDQKVSAASMSTTPTAADRASVAAGFQAEIDALNQVYAQQKQAEAIAGKNRIGSTGAINFASGMAGSNFGKSNINKQEGENANLQAAIDAKHNADIAAVYGKISTAAKEAAAARVEAARAGADALVESLKNKQTLAKEGVSTAISGYFASGNDGSKLTENDYSAWASQFKVPVSVVKSAVQTAIEANKKAKVQAEKDALENTKTTAEIAKIKAETNKALKDASTSNEWGAISNADKTDILNYLSLQPDTSPLDIERAKTDRTFQALILREVAKEKSGITNPFAE